MLKKGQVYNIKNIYDLDFQIIVGTFFELYYDLLN